MYFLLFPSLNFYLLPLVIYTKMLPLPYLWPYPCIPRVFLSFSFHNHSLCSNFLWHLFHLFIHISITTSLCFATHSSLGNALVFTTRSELRKVVFLAPSVCGFLFVYEISRELLNRFVPNTHGRRVWSLTWTSLKVKGRGHQGQKNRIFQPFGSLCVVYVW